MGRYGGGLRAGRLSQLGVVLLPSEDSSDLAACRQVWLSWLRAASGGVGTEVDERERDWRDCILGTD